MNTTFHTTSTTTIKGVVLPSARSILRLTEGNAELDIFLDEANALAIRAALDHLYPVAVREQDSEFALGGARTTQFLRDTLVEANQNTTNALKR